MAEVLPLSEGDLQLLESLVRHQVNFMVVGLSAAALQGAPVVTEDVDLWFEDLNDPRLTVALRAVGAAYVPPFGYNPPTIPGAHSEPFDVVVSMTGLGPFAVELKSAKQISLGPLVIWALSLERIIASKIAANRPRDRRIVPVLQNVLRTLNTKQTGGK